MHLQGMREIATASTPSICHFNLETAATVRRAAAAESDGLYLPMHFFASVCVFVRRLRLTAAAAALNSHKFFKLAHWLGISSHLKW